MTSARIFRDELLDLESGEAEMKSTTSRAQQLRSWIESQPVGMGRTWVEQLEDRKREEAEFHDSIRDEKAPAPPTNTFNKRFYEAAENVSRFITDWLNRTTPNGVFLDYACGDGKYAIESARAGASLAVGIDVSEVSVRNATNAAAEASVAERTLFLQRDCENTGLPEGSFDTCLCAGVLHHLDLHRSFPEIHRIMAVGGRVLCVEALAYNPVIQLYRNRTPHLRTDWEKQHILDMKSVALARKWFRVENVRFFLMTAPLATLLPAGGIRRAGIAVGQALDAVLTRIPLLRLWSWQFAFELVKEK